MTVTLTWLGHAAFRITDGTDVVLVDPFLTGNPSAAETADAQQPTVIVVSHAHNDHVGDAGAISARTGAPLVTTFELGTYLARAQGANAIPANAGGTVVVGGVSVKLVAAVHTSAYDDGETFVAPGAAVGSVIRIGGKAIYHAGDTALFGDMALIGSEGLDAALIPIGGHFTMDPSDAARAARLLAAPVVVPMHFNTFPPIQQDAGRLVDALAGDAAEVRVLAPGESTTL